MFKEEISSVTISFSGSKLLDSVHYIEKESSVLLALPGEFDFNHSWNLKFNCPFCSEPIEIKEDFDNRIKNYRWLKSLSTKRLSLHLLESLSHFYIDTYLYEALGVTYLNRSSFNYTSDFQRVSSVNLFWSKCSCCDRLIIGDVKIGYPILPERNLPSGKIGRVQIGKLVGIDESWVGYDELINLIEQ